MSEEGPITPFKISIPEDELTLLTQKLALTRLPRNETATYGEQNGVTTQKLTSLLTFWRSQYSWRAEESRLNQLPQYSTPIPVPGFGTLQIHFVHSPSPKPDSIPLLFLHGWPGSFAEVEKVLPLLEKQGFDVVAPSLPGFGFSEYPEKSGFKLKDVAGVVRALMRRLGYERFLVQGGDWGSHLSKAVGVMFPEEVKGLHFNMFYMPKPSFPNGEPTYTPFEQACLDRYENWFLKKESAYSLIQGSKPRTLGFAMHDSPIGMLAWICDKLFLWSDNYPWTPTELITWTLLHYFPGPTTAFQIYRENSREETSITGVQAQDFTDMPTGVSAFPKAFGVMPRSWVETKAKVVFWREHESGGHFAAYERPRELVEDVVEFAGKVWDTHVVG